MDLYAHAQTVDTKRSSPIFQAPGYEANPGEGLDQTKKVEKGEGEISEIANFCMMTEIYMLVEMIVLSVTKKDNTNLAINLNLKL